MSSHVMIRSSRYGIDIDLDPDVDFEDLIKELTIKFRDSARFFKDVKMTLSFSGRELNRTEEERIIRVIEETTQMEILCIVEYNDKNEMMYKNIIEKTLSDADKREGQFYRGTLGRHQILETDSSIVILGDVGPGARVITKGSAVIVGSVYGSVHAGAAGDKSAFVVSLSMQPQNLRIADVEARRQIIFQENLNIRGPKIAVVDGRRIYLDPLVD